MQRDDCTATNTFQRARAWKKRPPRMIRDGPRSLGPVEIHREFITAAARWMIAAKL
jgi:hypothetical protein